MRPFRAAALLVPLALLALAAAGDDDDRRNGRDGRRHDRCDDRHHHHRGDDHDDDDGHDDDHDGGDHDHDHDAHRGIIVFGPQKYVRTTGPRTVYTATVTVPAWVVAPYRLHVHNGEGDESRKRVTSATIAVNGTQVAGPSDFKHGEEVLDRPVVLTPRTTLVVTLTSKPGSYLTLWLLGMSGDHTAPILSVAAPPPGATINDAAPGLLLRYRDTAGRGEPAASGVDTATLSVTVDGVDRTGLFTRRSEEASAAWPPAQPLSEGTHTIRASVRDVAGKLGRTEANFRVDRRPPSIQVAEPLANAYLATRTPVLRVRYADDTALDLATLRVVLNGADQTALFVAGATEAVAVLSSATPLPSGPNQLAARIRDLGGNEAVASVAFNVDAQPPKVQVEQPSVGARLGAADVELVIHYSDDQALDLASFVAQVDGQPVELGVGPEGASGRVRLAEGGHSATVRIRDRASNVSETTVAFSVDTALPDIQVLQPLPGVVLATSTPQVMVVFSDAQGIDPETLRVMVDGADRTSLFTVHADHALATVPLADGTIAVTAEIADLAGNRARASSTFTVDTTAPAIVVAEPAERVATGRPSIGLTYSDAGTGVDPATVEVLVDGADITPLFAIGDDRATAVVEPGLEDGSHGLLVRLADRAGNTAEITATFIVDTARPQARFLVPASDTFINDLVTPVRLAWTDGTGTGVDPASLRLHLRTGEDPELDITGYVQAGPEGATGRIPSTTPLADGVYRLRADFADRVGNTATAESAFEVDTVAPTFRIEVPAPGAHVPTGTPEVAIVFFDERSGVDPLSIRLSVDGNDRTSGLAVENGRATADLRDPLSDGPHRLAVMLADRAGNTAGPIDHAFTVDTIAPVVTLVAPQSADLAGTAAVPVHVQYGDEGLDGIDPASVRVSVDDIDRTALFTIGTRDATGAVPLADGPHRIEVAVLDWAGNVGGVATTFGVDTAAPVVTLTGPADAGYHRISPAEIAGTVRDADPQVRVECAGDGAGVLASLRPAEGDVGVVVERTFTCPVPLSEGSNTVTVTATDRFAHEGRATLSLTLDSVAPALTVTRPLDGDYTAAAEVEVTGTIQDASPVTVSLAGNAANVDGSTFRGTVPVGDVAEVPLSVRATDAAGNETAVTLTIRVDRVTPVVMITRPVAGAYLKGPTLDVLGTVADGSPVLVDVNGEPATAVPGGFTASVSTADGPFTVRAIARDAAGNVGVAEQVVIVDSVPPAIEVDQPAEGFVTSAPSLRLVGTVSDGSPATVTLDGAPLLLEARSFSTDVLLPAEGPRVLSLTATDAAGNASTVEVHGIVDRTPPVLEVIGPAADAVVGARDALVQGTVADATAVSVLVDGVPAVVTGYAWQATVGDLSEGPHRFEVVAVDAAGNLSRVLRDVVVDLAPPVLTILSPEGAALTRNESIEVTGTVVDGTAGTLSVTGADPVPTSPGSFPFAFTIALAEGDTRIDVTATDSAHRTATATLTVTRDGTPPVVELTAPDRISRGRGGVVLASATDALGIAQVRLLLSGALLASFTAPPYRADLAVPDGALAGEILTVTAEASDRAGNVTRASQTVRVVSDGALVGQVLDDATGLVLPGARVRVRTLSGERLATTDEAGRYAVPASDLSAVLEIDKDGMTRAVRDTPISSGVGTAPLDARLTTLATPVEIAAEGGALTAGSVSVQVPPGAVAAATTFRLTPLSAQGLPQLLPLGWSPLAAFDLRADGAVPAAALTATVSGLPDGVVHVVATNAPFGWALVAPDLPVVEGAATFEVPAAGEYAVVMADEPDVSVGLPGETLTGVDPVPLPVSARSTGPVVPAQVPPAGGTAVGELALESPVPLTSGTVIQAEVTETYQLTSTDVASTERRVEDVVLYRRPAPATAALAARLPITPSRTFGPEELAAGNVHVEFVSGREDVRGRTGGSEPVTLDAGPVRLQVAAGSLGEDTAIELESAALSSFLPSATGVVPVAEAVVDLWNSVVGIPANLSVATDAVTPGDTVLLCRVVRLDGVPRLSVVAAAALEGGRLVPRPIAGLPGVVEGGRYVWYRTSPVGFASGTTLSDAGPISAVVTGAGLPFVALSRADGHFVLPILSGPTVALEAVAPHTSLRGTASASVAPGDTVAVDLTLAGAVTTASVLPADGALGQPVSVQVEINAATALDPATVTVQNVRLLRGDPAQGQAVPVRLVLAVSGRRLAVVPASALDFSTTYTLEAGGLADRSGSAVIVPVTTFTTKDDTPPVYDFAALTFSFPDASGLISLTAPAGSLPSGTQLLVINAGNGMVLTTTARNDGSVEENLPGSINDRMLVTITDPQGNVTSFERSQFVAPDGRVAIGPGGGVVKGEGGIQMRIPDGALEHGVVLKIEPFGPDRFPPDQQPDMPGGHFGGGITIHSEDKPTFKKEAKLAFPVPPGLPADPADALFFVYRRLEGPNGRVAFETIDYATIEGEGATARVVTASDPFAGIINFLGFFDSLGVTRAVSAVHYLLVWRMKELFPGGPTPGVITGRTRRPIFGTIPQQTQGIPGVLVSGVDDRGQPLYEKEGTSSTVAISQPSGKYTLWDPNFTGGTVNLVATAPAVPPATGGEVRRATAYELVESTALEIRKLFGLYDRVATADITFPATLPSPKPTGLDVRLFRTVNGSRIEAGGIVTVGTPLIVGFKGEEVTQTEWKVQFGQAAPDWLATIPDPMAGTASVGVDRITDTEFLPGEPGIYTFSATGVAPFGGTVTGTATIRVVAAGGTNATAIQGQPPRVITIATVPKLGATGVPVVVFPQLTFTEPVRNVPGHVILSSAAGPIPCRLVGVSPDGGVIDDLTDPNSVVTSLTLQPARALDFRTDYHLELTADIVDLDMSGGVPTPTPLTPFDLQFKTFDPGPLGNTADPFGSAGISVVSTDTGTGGFQSFAYLAENRMADGILRIFDITDPGAMTEVAPDPAAENFVWGRPADIAAVSDRVAIATNPTNAMRPSNLYVFDVADKEKPKWVGGVSLSTSASDGWIRRLAMDDLNIYAATFRKGIQVIDRGKAEFLFGPPGAGRALKVRMFNTPGEGFGADAIVQAIGVFLPDGRPARLFDVKVRDYDVDDLVRPFAVSVGETGAAFVVADTATGVARTEPAIVTADWRMDWAEALALGRVGQLEIAAVGGTGKIGSGTSVPSVPMLAIVSMAFPNMPMGLGTVQLPHAIGDVVLRDTRAIVTAPGTGAATVVDVTDPAHPVIVGSLTDVGSRIAFDAPGTLFSTERSIGGGPHPLGGVRAMTFGPRPFIRSVEPIAVAIDPTVTVLPTDPEPIVPIFPTTLQVGMAPASYPVTSVSLQLFKTLPTGTAIAVGSPIPLVLSNGSATHVIPPSDLRAKVGEAFSAILTVTTSGGVTLQTPPRPLLLNRLRVRLDSNNDTFLADESTAIDQKDKDAVFVGRAFGFWTTSTPSYSPSAETSNGLLDWATIRVRRSQSLPAGSALALRIPGATWYLARKLSDGKKAFSMQDRATAQLNEIKANAKPSSGATGEVVIPREWLAEPETELLIKFSQPPASAPAAIALYYTAPSGLGPSEIHSGQAKVQELSSWLSVYSLHRSGALPPEDRFRPKPNATLLSPWAPVPSDARQITVLIHGFNVNETDATERFFPGYFKRLYWSGHPVLAEQRVTVNGVDGAAHTVGISWPGDMGSYIQASAPPVPGSAFFFFPEDEMHALQAGVPTSALLESLRNANPADPAQARRLDVIAHSLGNMVINSALTRLGAQSVIDRYIMNEAAVPSIAFHPGHETTFTLPDAPEFKHLLALGYPDDEKWRLLLPSEIAAYAQLINDPSSTTPVVDSALYPKPHFERRWTQERSSTPPDQTTDFAPRRGPWKNFFAGTVVDPGHPEVHNTYSSADKVLTVAWEACQLLQKPDVIEQGGIEKPIHPLQLPQVLINQLSQLASPVDLLDLLVSAGVSPAAFPTGTTHFWATLWNTGSEERTMWNDGNHHTNITRQWAELAYWFPAVSPAAGSVPLHGAVTNHNFTPYSENTDFGTSHSYMLARDYPHVWNAFQTLQQILKR